MPGVDFDRDRVARAAVHRNGCAMMFELDQMSAVVFAAVLKSSGFRIDGIQVVDISGACPGFTVTAVTRRGRIDRTATLRRALTARQAEIAVRKLGAWNDGEAVTP